MIDGVGGVALLAAVALVACAAVLGYWAWEVRKPAVGNPADFVARARVPGQRVLVCAGASIVHGRVSVDFVELLRQRLPADAFACVNAGENGDLAYNVLRRLDSVIACDPDYVVLLVGTNDVQATLSDRIRRLSMRGKHLPCAPTIDWYRENMAEIVARLGAETRARVALCALPILGEDLDTPANRRVAEFNAVLREVAAAHGATYLPIHERQAAHLRAAGRDHGPPYTENPAPVMAASMRRYLLRQGFDDISRRAGLALTTDRIHMNTAGASMIADEIEQFVRSA
jgi:lysophospholipase L1-like esterase